MSGTMMGNKPPSADPDSPVLGRAPSPVQAERGSAAVGDESNAEVIPPGSPLTNRSQRSSPLRDVFVGPDGIYSLPRLLIYVAMAGLVFQVETWLVISIQPDLGPSWWRMVVEATMMLAAIAPGFVMTRIERRPFEDFGLPPRSAFRGNFWVGALWGIVSLSVLMVVLRVVGVFEFGGLVLHGVRIWKFAAYYAVLFLITGFFEEFLMRGYSQWVLARGINFWPAAVFLSIAFGSIHGRNPGETTTGLVAAGCIGFFLCLTLRRTGNLWWAVGFHMAWDWGESYLYSVPDSGTLMPGHLLNSSFRGPDWLTGGSVGPEGSYLVFVVIAVLWFAFDRVYPQVKYISTK